MNNEDFKKLQVDKENDEVEYNDAVHKYWTKKSLNPCISVTTLIHKFSTFDEHFWSRYKALEAILGEEEFKPVKPLLLENKIFKEEILQDLGIDKEDFDEEVERILGEWEEKRERACERGTKIHKDYELKTLASDYSPLEEYDIPRFFNGGNFKVDTTNKLQEGNYVLPELLLSRISEDGILRIAGQADLIVVSGQDVYILDYKGLDINTPILTTKGFKLLKDITNQDIIFDKDGNETKILNISEEHLNPCYKITFDNNDEIIADHEHRWLISFRKSKGVFVDKVLTTEELINYMSVYNSSKNSYHLPKIKNASPLNRDYVELPIDPYILGYWLGDGTSIAGSITCANPDFWEEAKRRGFKIGEDVGQKEGCELRTLFGLRTELNKLNLLNNKHIPNIYLLASYEQRLDLLRGFMDADGYYNSTRKRFVMATTVEKQADYLITLLATLGVKATKIPCIKYCNNKEFNGWDVCFTMEDNPFLLRNQTGIEYPKTDKSSFRNIKSIELVETIPTKCLEVDSPSHTFLFGYSLIPTHNSNKEIKTKSFYDRKKRTSSRMKYPLNNLDDVNYYHYEMQLSTYAWIIEKNNPNLKVKGLFLLHHDHKDHKTVYKCEYRKADVERMLAFYKKEIEYQEHKNRNTKWG